MESQGAPSTTIAEVLYVPLSGRQCDSFMMNLRGDMTSRPSEAALGHARWVRKEKSASKHVEMADHKATRRSYKIGIARMIGFSSLQFQIQSSRARGWSKKP